MSDIFISHAVADQALAKLLVDFLKEAIGVPGPSIFCSSVTGHGIPLGEDFNNYIKIQIKHPKLVILLMTPAYMESTFCLMELGAAWAQDASNLAIVVPPISFDTVTKTLGLKQAWNITDKPRLIDLKALVVKVISKLETRSDHTWDEKRTNFHAAVKKLIPKLKQATKVDAATHQKSLEEIIEKAEEIERLESALGVAQEKYAELEKLKDKEEVKKLKKSAFESQALQEEFDVLIAAVEDAKPKASQVVLKHIILDHFGLAGSIDWYNDKQEFEAAIKYGLIDSEDFSVRWERSKLKPLAKALDAVRTFLGSEEGDRVKSVQEPGVPMEPDDLEFWEHHLGI